MGAAMKCIFEAQLASGQEQGQSNGAAAADANSSAWSCSRADFPCAAHQQGAPPGVGLTPSAGAAAACAGPRRGRAAKAPPAQCPRTDYPGSPSHGCGAGQPGALLSLVPAWGQGLEAGYGFAKQAQSFK